jgi:AraC-like DNA-binding protein
MHSQSSGSDPLASVIALLRPQAVFSKIISGAGRWSIRYEAHEDPGFTIVLAGSCFLTVPGSKTIEISEGDFVFLPPTSGFTMASDPSLKPTLVSPTSTDLRHGTKTGPASMRMLGGYFHFDRTNSELLVKFLPAIVHIRKEEPRAARLHKLVELIGDEAGDHRAGRELILHRLVEVLLVEALRFRPATAAKQEQGLLAGLADPALSRALRRIHDDVARRWTVAELARAAGMSRAVFAERFMRKVGMPPMQYVLEWRIAIAKDILRRERAPLADVAEKIGYQSASAFSTAFTRHAGCAPSVFARAE